MRTKSTSRLSLLFLSFALVLALPAIALADTLTVSNTLITNTDTSKAPGGTGTANVWLDPTNNDSTTPLDKSGCNASTATGEAATVTLRSTNSAISFPNGASADLTACGSENAKQIAYNVAGDAQAGQAVIQGTVTGGKSGQTNQYNVNDALTVTITAPAKQNTAVSKVSGSGTYAGNADLTATLKTAAGTALSGKSVTFTLNGNSVGSANTDASGVATTSVSLSGINAGTHTNYVSANFAGDTSNNGSTASGDLTVAKANGSVSVNNIPSTPVFGDNFTPDYTKAGDGAASVSSLTEAKCTVSSTGVVNFVAAGTCTLQASVAEGTNHLATTGSQQTFEIAKAPATLSFATGTLSKTYNGSAQGVQVNTDPAGLNTVTVDYFNKNADGTKGSALTGAPTNAGSYMVEASLTNNNYQATAISGTLVIDKAATTTTVNCTGGPFTYNGSALTPCSVSVKGAGGLDLAPNANYSDNTNAGTATASYTFAGDANYTGSSDFKNFTIGRAQLSVDAKNQSTVYGDSHLASSYALSGFVNGETAATAGVTGAPECSITSSATSVGTYPGVISCTTGTLDAANYSFASGANGDLTIKNRPIAVAPDAGQSKTYGDSDPALEFHLANNTTLGHTDTLADATDGALSRTSGENVGTYAINQGTLVATGNYSLNFVANGATFEIKPKPITITPNAGQSKVYGQGDPALTYTPSPALKSGDNFTGALSRAPGENAGSYAITLGSLTAGTNYTLSLSSTPVNFAITQKPVTGSFTAANKTYDGGTSATVLSRSVNAADVVGSDDVTLTGGTASFADKNVGNGKIVTLTGATLGGAASANYSLTSVSTTTANITARDLTVTATGVNKLYDGTTNATVNLSTDKLNGDTVTASYTGASFADKNVGNGKAVSVNGISILGADAANYNLTNTTASATANITPLGITGSFTAADKVWDGSTAATVNGRSLTGVLGNDAVSLAGGTANFDNANVGTGKTVTLSGASLTGTDAGNYSLSSVNTTTASILAWTTKGFYQPVDMGGITNTVKGGSTVPLKFELFAGATELTDTASIKSLTYAKVNCDGTLPIDEIETVATGGTSLRYDSTGGQYIYNWKTPTAIGCYKVTMTAQDGSTISALFKTR